jgi:hypothetical protein
MAVLCVRHNVVAECSLSFSRAKDKTMFDVLEYILHHLLQAECEEKMGCVFKADDNFDTLQRFRVYFAHPFA